MTSQSSSRRRPLRVPSPRKKLARILVRPPIRPSEGAQAMNAMFGSDSKLSRLDPVPRQYHTVINWGNTSPLNTGGRDVRVLNKPEAIAGAVNKLLALGTLRDGGVRVPDFSAHAPAEAGDIWLARTVLGGSGGAGIVVVRPGESFPDAPLYVKYIRKTMEMRIHVAFGQPIFLQLKLRQSNNEQTADQKLIRNHDNGWVFAPRPIEGPILEAAAVEAVKAVAALGLDFGAVDLIVGKKDVQPYVLEVNTAPGIQSPTLIDAYRDVFTKEITV